MRSLSSALVAVAAGPVCVPQPVPYAHDLAASAARAGGHRVGPFGHFSPTDPAARLANQLCHGRHLKSANAACCCQAAGPCRTQPLATAPSRKPGRTKRRPCSWDIFGGMHWLEPFRRCDGGALIPKVRARTRRRSAKPLYRPRYALLDDPRDPSVLPCVRVVAAQRPPCAARAPRHCLGAPRARPRCPRHPEPLPGTRRPSPRAPLVAAGEPPAYGG
jgi:hypothetical protein